MKTLVVYGSKYGAAETCAKRLAALLGGEVTVANAKAAPPPQGYDRVVIGSSVYVGTIRKEVKAWCKQHEAALKAARLGLFVSCSEPSPAQEEYLRANLPALLETAVVNASFGGEFSLEKMNGFERWLIRQIGKGKKAAAAPAIDAAAIEAFAQAMA